MAAQPKQPQDHKPKKEAESNGQDEPDEFFEFTASDGTTFRTIKPTLDVLTPGYVRRNRGNQEELVWGAIEQLADKDLLDWIDTLTGREGNKEWKRFQNEFIDHIGASLGE
jgi:hypothetical protein